MKRLSQRQKDALDALAQSSMYTEEGHEQFGLLRKALSVQESMHTHDGEALSARSTGRSGIWERQVKGTVIRYVRAPESSEPSSLWANIGAIEPKGRHKRVVLLGESVARGFFFDPHFNPAMALQHTLRTVSGDREVEVVDLARTDLLLDPLKNLAIEAVELQPDVVVVFAGNNWQPTNVLSRDDFLQLSKSLRQGAWSGVKRRLEDLLRERVKSLVEVLVALAQKHRFTLLFVLPEFNLADWRTEAPSPCSDLSTLRTGISCVPALARH